LKGERYMELIYYLDHDERYKHLPPRVRLQYPDEIRTGLPHRPVIKRVKNYKDLTREDQLRYGVDLIDLAAKDIPFREGMNKGQ